MLPVIEVLTILNTKHEGKHLMKLPPRKIKPITFLLLILTLTIISLSLLTEAKAETKIISITPQEGVVGTTLQLTANISTTDGQYRIMFDENEVLGGNATGINVTASFSIPHAPEGAHNVTIIDVTKLENDTKSFTVLTSYSLNPVTPESPAQIQEGGNVTISINMTGGNSNYTYPNITVQTPSGNLTYEALKNITTTATGDFCDNLTYPNDFSSGANTNFTGEYKILFNATIANQFFIGLTNSSIYHRGDFINIKAVDYYPPNENVTLTVKFGDVIIDYTSLNATDGVINANWPIPLNATVGSYTLTITPVPKFKKEANDTQSFDVPGFKTEIFTRNIANKTVPDILVKAYDVSANTYYDTTSGTDGLAVPMLDIGNYSCEAFFKEVRVGEMNFTITNEEQVNFTCQLTTMSINVIDAQNVNIPKVSIGLSYNYTTDLGEKQNRTGTDYGETGITGILQLHSLLPNVTYSINASRYGQLFNQGNDTLNNLPAISYVDVAISCPARTLQVNVIDAQNQSIVNANVEAQESMGGLHYSKPTDIDGKAVLNCTFGRYFVKAYADEILLNETTVDLFQDQNISMICKLYGLNVSIKVVDYFGQPISKANVTLQREGLGTRSILTQSDGTVTFSNIIGGTLQISVYSPGQTQPYVTNTFTVDNSATIQFKIDKYVLLAGFLIETSQLTTTIIIVLTVILIVSIEVYRRKRFTQKKSSG